MQETESREGEAPHDDGAEAARRARVRAVLIEPLEAMGMRPHAKATGETHAAFLGRIERRVAYLRPELLEALREVVARNAEFGKRGRDVWPSELAVVNWAAALEPPPVGDSRMVRSYMASAAGLRAWEEGPAVAVVLYDALKREGRPPAADWDWNRIRTKGMDLAAEIDRIEGRLAAGWGKSEDAARLEAFVARRDRVRSLVFAARDAEGAPVADGALA